MTMSRLPFDHFPSVIPAKAGIQGPKRDGKRPWTPAFAGVTG